MLPPYAELHCRSNFSFLTGASHPEELLARAAELGYEALAITDECSVAGVVRAHEELKRQREKAASSASSGTAVSAPPIRLLLGTHLEVSPFQPDHPDQRPQESQTLPPGAEVAGPQDLPGHPPAPPPAVLEQGLRVVLLAHNRTGWGDLCELITLSRARCAKGHYCTWPQDLLAHQALAHCTVLLIARREDSLATLLAQARWCAQAFGARAALAIERLLWADDSLLMERVQAVVVQLQSEGLSLPIAAAGDVLMHRRSRKPVQDTLTAIRLRRPLSACGTALARNAEQHLRSRLQLAQLYRPQWLQATVDIARRCPFNLSELRYEYPAELVPEGRTPIEHLRALTAEGALQRHPGGVPPSVQVQIEREFELIEALHYEPFFLTVHDIVRFARSRGILCQGRGSAANSAVCWCLGITEVDPTQTTLLFERFISRERAEPPDIDVDFEHERREEVIQYIYAKYGEHRCALAAAVTAYRSRGAVRDVGAALGLDASIIDQVARSVHGFDDPQRLERSLAELGLEAQSPLLQRWLQLVQALHRFPRHLSQHTGGFVIAAGLLSRLVPIEPAAMDNRRVIQWDKDDLESLGLLKVDVLALGMLTVIRKTLHLMTQWHAWPHAEPHHRRADEAGSWRMQDIPREDAATFAMACGGDTVGVFQIESRAQQTMLPRLKPRTFYDLVVQVAIVRPGPIQGGMVHPYLKRRVLREQGQLSPSPYPALDVALGRTLGVPIFQEQVMQICVIAAGFTPGEADGLRRSMAAWRKKGELHVFHDRIVQGMVQRGYPLDFAQGIFRQIEGFGEYGFPESHAYSFALLTYLSAWMKCHEPEAFLAALLNSQPMGFYAPSQLVQDARRHRVVVHPVDAAYSEWDCSLEPATGGAAAPAAGRPAVRLGLRMVSGLSEAVAHRLVQARAQAPFQDVQDMAMRAGLQPADLQRLARADALHSLAGHRRLQLWQASGAQVLSHRSARQTQLGVTGDLFAQLPAPEPHTPALSPAPEGQAITLDYASTGLSLRRHPLALMRPRLHRRGWRSAQELQQLPDGRRAWACGLVTMRQQPATAKGTTFITLEDETGCLNVIVWRDIRERQRLVVLNARLLAVVGEWQNREGVMHLVARRLLDVSAWLGELGRVTASRDFR